MSNTYSQIILQIVFAVKFRQQRIDKAWKEELHTYIAGIINKSHHRCLIVNSMPDHIHILVSVRPHPSISDLVREIKKTTSIWINERMIENRDRRSRFRWQEGFAVFSYNTSMKQIIYDYILNQEKHHEKTRFSREFTYLMKDNELDFDPIYAGEFLMDDTG